MYTNHKTSCCLSPKHLCVRGLRAPVWSAYSSVRLDDTEPDNSKSDWNTSTSLTLPVAPSTSVSGSLHIPHNVISPAHTKSLEEMLQVRFPWQRLPGPRWDVATEQCRLERWSHCMRICTSHIQSVPFFVLIWWSTQDDVTMFPRNCSAQKIEGEGCCVVFLSNFNVLNEWLEKNDIYAEKMICGS